MNALERLLNEFIEQSWWKTLRDIILIIFFVSGLTVLTAALIGGCMNLFDYSPNLEDPVTCCPCPEKD